MARKPNKASSGPGGFVILNGQRIELVKDERDFSVLASEAQLRGFEGVSTSPLSSLITRVSAPSAEARDPLMDEVRGASVAHHIYRKADTGEEIIINDEIVVTLRQEGTGELDAIMSEFQLDYVRKMGESHVLRLTPLTNSNPVKTANAIAERPGVAAASPQILIDLQFHAPPPLLSEQWYLSAELVDSSEVAPDSGVRAPEAWSITKGSSDIVVAVIDDGFDLEHPAFANVRLHPRAYDFQGDDSNPGAQSRDYHGTPVASIAVGAHGPVMHGIAPGCTFLPIRIGFGPMARQVDLLSVFEYASRHADVVNCSFGTPPRSMDVLHPEFRRAVTRLTESGGRRGKGLVIVFSAANDDAPTYLSGPDNRNGVKYTRFTDSGAVIEEIPAGSPVYSGHPMTAGVIVVGAMSSTKRKAGYSCWGPHLTVTAPSNNSHYIAQFVSPGSDARRDAFDVAYRGLGQVAAVNRPGVANPFSPIGRVNDPDTPYPDNQYTRLFGGTSGAAPVVTGIAALILSANPSLTAAQVKQIIRATAAKDLDVTLDCPADPNLQGIRGDFIAGVSPYFGAGKIDAFRAVQRAHALAAGAVEPSVATTDDATEPGGPGDGTAEPANVSVPRLVYERVLKSGGSIVLRGDVPPPALRDLAELAAQQRATITVKAPFDYSAAWMEKIAEAGDGRITFDFS
jgi:subtilisin family serine protease